LVVAAPALVVYTMMYNGTRGEVNCVQRTNIYLEEEQLRALKYLAAEERQSVADLVREAVDDYLAKRMVNGALWRERFDTLIERVQSRVTTDIPPVEIEADVSAARDEVRRAHRAARRR